MIKTFQIQTFHIRHFSIKLLCKVILEAWLPCTRYVIDNHDSDWNVISFVQVCNPLHCTLAWKRCYYYIDLWSNIIMCVKCPEKVKCFKRGNITKTYFWTGYALTCFSSVRRVVCTRKSNVRFVAKRSVLSMLWRNTKMPFTSTSGRSVATFAKKDSSWKMISRITSRLCTRKLR